MHQLNGLMRRDYEDYHSACHSIPDPRASGPLKISNQENPGGYWVSPQHTIEFTDLPAAKVG